MKRENFYDTVIVVTSPDGHEVEINGGKTMGNLDEDASLSLMIGSAVREMLTTLDEGDEITIEIFSI